MLPYWFSAMTMKSVGIAAEEMVRQVKTQFSEPKGIELLAHFHAMEEYKEKIAADPTDTTIVKPDKVEIPEDWYKKCITTATKSSLKEMIAPSALVMLTPLIVGIFFGKYALSGLLIGGITSGVQMALSASNTGGAWDNAKKYIEANKWNEEDSKDPSIIALFRDDASDEMSETEKDLNASMHKGTEAHKAAVIGDTVGDPLKDTSGPAINILMKLMAIIALVFAPFIAACRDGYGLVGCSLNKNCNA